MWLNNENADECLKYDFHDAEIEQLNWGIGTNQLHAMLVNHYRKKRISMCFQDVLFVEGVTVNFTYGRCDVNCFDIAQDKDVREEVEKRIYTLQHSPPSQWMSYTKEKVEKAVIGRFLLASAEFIHIACLGVEIEQHDLIS